MGIEQGDIVVQINGRPIKSLSDLRYALAASDGCVRVLVLDNRTNDYFWHEGDLIFERAPSRSKRTIKAPDS